MRKIALLFIILFNLGLIGCTKITKMMIQKKRKNIIQ